MRLVWKQAALPGTSRLKIWRRVGDSNSCALAVRQFSGLLGYQLPIPSALLIVGRPGETVPKTSVSAIPPPAHWSTEPDSNWLRTGLQAAASTASAFSAKKKLF